MDKRIEWAVIPAAGRGTRLRPLTNRVPKELLRFWGMPMIDYAIREAEYLGVRQLVIVVSPERARLLNHVRSVTSLCLHYVTQDAPLGLGHAIWSCRNILDGHTFVVLLPDEIYEDQRHLDELLQATRKDSRSAILIAPIPRSHVNRFGVVTLGDPHYGDCRVHSICEKPRQWAVDDSPFGILGRYVIGRELFDLWSPKTSRSTGEWELTDGLKCLAAKERLLAVKCPNRRLDLGTLQTFMATLREPCARDVAEKWGLQRREMYLPEGP